jgi:hypothetical protein
MSQDVDVSLHCHCNFAKAVSREVSFLRRGNSQRIEFGFRIESERVSKDLYRLLLNDQWIYPFFQKSVFSAEISAMTPTPVPVREFPSGQITLKKFKLLRGGDVHRGTFGFSHREVPKKPTPDPIPEAAAAP